MKKLLSCILAAVCALSLFAVTACNRKPTMSNGEELDPNRVQLYVGNLYGGYGDGWLYEVKERFEKAYADYEFPNGKTGVQVWINSDRDKYFGTTMMNTVGGMTDEVFFQKACIITTGLRAIWCSTSPTSLPNRSPPTAKRAASKTK